MIRTLLALAVMLAASLPAAAQGPLTARDGTQPPVIVAPAPAPVFATGEARITVPATGATPEQHYRIGTIAGTEYWYAEDGSGAGIDRTPEDRSSETYRIACNDAWPEDFACHIAASDGGRVDLGLSRDGTPTTLCIAPAPDGSYPGGDPAAAPVDGICTRAADDPLIAEVLQGGEVHVRYAMIPGQPPFEADLDLTGLDLALRLLAFVWPQG